MSIQRNNIFPNIEDILFSPLLNKFTNESIENLIDTYQIIQFPENAIIFQEGDADSSLFILLYGSVDVLKYDKKTSEYLKISSLSGFDFFGEMSFCQDHLRSATLKTSSECEIIKIDRNKILALASGNEIFEQMKINITNSQNLINRIRLSTNHLADTLQNEKKILLEQKSFGTLYALTISQFLLLIIVNDYISKLDNVTKKSLLYGHLFWWTYILIILCPIVIFILKNKKSFFEFGLSFENIKKTLRDTFVFITLCITFIFFIIHFYFHKINFYTLLKSLLSFDFITYFIHSFLQEFVSRGVIQSSLFNLFGSKKHILPIFMSSIMFACIHIFLGINALIVTFIYSLFAGYVFKKQRNIYGITMIHAILGFLAFNLSII